VCTSCSIIAELRGEGASEVPLDESADVWTGPKIPIAVCEFDDATGIQPATSGPKAENRKGAAKARSYQELRVAPNISQMRSRLTSFLAQTNAFRVFDGVDAPSRATWLIRGAVTDYEPSAESIAAGYGREFGDRLPPKRPSKPKVDGSVKQDYVAIQVDLLNVSTGEILASTRIEALPRDTEFALRIPGIRNPDIHAQLRAPMSKALNACLVKAAVWTRKQAVAQRELAVHRPDKLDTTPLSIPEPQALAAGKP
jgi:curli biogenesis system outer membrane secretion channel CsgG